MLADAWRAGKIRIHEIPTALPLIMERPYIQNPFPPPPRRIGASLLFFSMAAVAVAGCGYLIWSLVAPESTLVPSAAEPTATAQSEIGVIVAQLRVFQTRAGRYPTASEGLDALVERPLHVPRDVVWPKFWNTVPRDPWGRSYEYEETPGNPPGYRIVSKGPKAEDVADDISQAVPPAPAGATTQDPPPVPPVTPKFR